MKMVLLLLYEHSHFTELLRLVRLLKQDQEFEPVFFFSRMLVFSPYVARVCKAEDIPCLDSEGRLIDLNLAAAEEKKPVAFKGKEQGTNPVRRGIPFVPVISREWERAIIRGWKGLFWPAKRMVGLGRRFSKDIHLLVSAITALVARKRRIGRFLRNHEISLLIMAEDNVYFDTAVWIQLAHRRKIPSIIVPYTISNPLEQAESALYDPPLRIDSLPKRIVRLFYPRWVYVHQDTSLLRLPWYHVVAREWLRLSSPHPWMLNSGSADAIAVESNAMQEYYLREGLPPEALFLTGALSDDDLARVLQQREFYRARLMEDAELDPSLPLALFALPPDQFPRNCEFPDYEELIGFLGAMASDANGWNVVIRPHPKQVEKEIGLVSRPGCKITWQDTASLVPLCSLYVACASATIRWAIACGIPVINYDVYQYHYSDYKGVPGVLYADDRDTFMHFFKTLTTDQGFYDEIVTKQQRVMSDWGLLDGKSGQRLMRLIRRLSQA